MSNFPAAGFRPQPGWVAILVPACCYLLAARLSLYLAIAPSESAAVWPPAGIAVASIILLDKRASVGVFLGAMLQYAISLFDTQSAATVYRSSALILLLSIGPALQALLVAYLLKRFSQPNLALISEAAILRFLFLCAPLGCLVAATFAMSVFFLFGITDADEILFSWLSWWVGDSIGVMTMTPLLLVLFQKDSPASQSRRLSVGMPMALLLIIVFLLFFYSQQRDRQEVTQRLETIADRLHADFEVGLEQNLNAIYSLKNYFESSEYVSPQEFDRFSRGLLYRNPHIQGLEWIPRVPAGERREFELRSDSPPGIVEAGRGGKLVPAMPRAEYYPVKYVTPLAGNEHAYGFDVASNPGARIAQQRAIKSGEASATRPITLVQEDRDESGVVVYLPVYRHGEQRGLVAIVIRATDYLTMMLRSSGSGDSLEIEVTDTTDQSLLLFSNLSSRAAPGFAPEFWQSLNFGGRVWTIHYRSSRDFINQQSYWSSLMVLLGGMIFTALFGGWLLTLTGQTMRVAREVDRRVVELRQEVAERELVQKELRKLSLAVEHSPSMVLICDPSGIIEYINPKFTDVAGYSLKELRGRDANFLYEAEYGQGFFSGLIGGLEVEGEWKGEVRSQKKSGGIYWAQISLAPIFDAEGRLSHVVSVHQDITENKAIQEQINYQARHDALTGLINRYEFERELQRLIELQQLTGTAHAYCFCDLDQFKVINDTSGHAAGDALLRQVADVLRGNLRKQDVLARIGGDEFGILMENCSLEEAEKVAHKILSEVESYRFLWEDTLHTIGVSIGVVAIDDACHEVAEVLKNADSACFTAKDAGRNRVHVYRFNDELLAKREGEISWIAEINSALEENRFELFGQVIIPIHDQALKPSIEVLIRLRRNGEFILPGAFLPAAERYGLSPKIDRWVVRKAFEWLEMNRETAETIDSLAINLSGQSLGDARLLEFIFDQLRRERIDPRAVKFEITETSAIANLAESRKFIQSVKELGCGFSLDDFGSGLSSFAYLKNLAVDYLKIDGMFIKDIASDPIDRAMVKSINEIGQVMQKKTIAEFVENDEILRHLRELGVDYAQGYGVGVPKPLAQVLVDIRRRHLSVASSRSPDYNI